MAPTVNANDVVLPEPSANPTATSAAMPAIFSTVKTSEKIAPAFTPSTLTLVRSNSPTMATTLVAAAPMGTKYPR